MCLFVFDYFVTITKLVVWSPLSPIFGSSSVVSSKTWNEKLPIKVWRSCVSSVFFFFFLLTGCCTSLIPEQFSTDHPDSYTVTVEISLSLLLYSKFRLKIATVKNCFSALLRSFSCSDSNIEIISQIFRSSLQFNARNPNRTNMYIRVETSKYICRITLGEWKWNQANLRQLDLVHYARYYIIYMLFCLEYLPFVSVPCRFQFLSIVHRVRDR